jgi:hypothetical protein
VWNWHLAIHGEVAGWLTALGTLFLAGAACYALKQLSEAKSDRHVQVFGDMGRRWESAEMMETLQMEADHTRESLLELFEWAAKEPLAGPTEEAKRVSARKDRNVLLRVPNYFEEAAAIQKVGSLRLDLMDDYFGGVAKDEWDKLWGPTIKKLQESDPTSFVDFRRMAERAD